MRSYLFVPGDSERKLEKALGTGADCLLIDLEDSVSPARKAAAREMTTAFLRQSADAANAPKLIVRINALDTGLTEDDLDAVVGAKPYGVLLPKSESGADVQHLAALLSVREAEAGLADGTLRIHALIAETAAGVLAASSYRAMTDRLEAVTWGGEDLAADLGASANRAKDGGYLDAFRLARSLTLLGAAAAKVLAIDTVFTDFRDPEGLEAECHAAVRDGFSGKLAIHPGQVETINRIFTPSAEATAWARSIVELFAEAGPDAGVLSLDGQMIDRPHLRQAERILARAKASNAA